MESEDEKVSDGRDKSNEEWDFNFNYKRMDSNASKVQAHFDFTDVKRTLQTRLKNYKEAIDYWEQVSRPPAVIQKLKENADKIVIFLKNYKQMNEADKCEGLLNIPNDIWPIDIGIDIENNKISEQVSFVEKTISWLNQEKQKIIKIMKAQNEAERKICKKFYGLILLSFSLLILIIAKSSAMKIVSLIREQETLKNTLNELMQNRWQPPPIVRISDYYFDAIEEKSDNWGMEVSIKLPPSYENSIFSYYFIIKINRKDETMDKKKIPIAGRTWTMCFELDDFESSNINIYDLEIEIYQWRFGILDWLCDTETIGLKSLRPSKPLK